MQRIFSAEHEQLVRQERSLLEELRVHIAKLDANDADLDLLKTTLNQLEEFFLLVVVGEFNAGKTAFLNALLGNRLLAEGVTPTTSDIHLIRYGDPQREEFDANQLRLVYVPVDWLREVNLVDTPGANAVIRQHQALTEHFVPRSDLVLFVTSADRPFSESERLFLERIREWGKKVVIIVNKIDLFDDSSERQQILDFVHSNARQLLGEDPQVFLVSARLALQAKIAARANGLTAPAGEQWEASRFAALERFLLESLDAKQRLRLKLENPLGIVDRILTQYRQVAVNRQELLRDDFKTLDEIEAHLAAYEADMRRDFKYQISRVDNVLYAMAERGDKFFDETLRIGRIFDLLNSEKLRGEFERQVVSDTSRQVEQHVSELIDWLVDKDHRQWRDVMEFLNDRAHQYSDRMVGQVGRSFEYNRQKLIESVGRNAQAVVDSYDRSAESLKLAQEVQRALVQTAAVEAGALGLGALLVVLLHGAALDVTGILSASAVAALGLYVLPARRSKVKNDLRQRIGQLRSQLEQAISRQFESELGASIQRLREAIAPYTRFVRVERDKIEKIESDLHTAGGMADSLRKRIRAL
jgi:small GTP-binding protein